MIFNGNNFDIDRYLGTWYEIARYPTFWEDNLKFYESDSSNKIVNVSCDFATAKYSKLDNGNVEVLNTCYYGTKAIAQSIGEAYSASRDDMTRGRLKVQFDENIEYNKEGDYIIHYTDYQTLSIVSNGMKSPDPRGQMIWILSRKMVPDDDTLRIVVKVLSKLDVDRSRLVGLHSKALKLFTA